MKTADNGMTNALNIDINDIVKDAVLPELDSSIRGRQSNSDSETIGNHVVNSETNQKPKRQRVEKTEAPVKKHVDAAFDSLWKTAAASKARKPKETQVWIDNELYRMIEIINLKQGKPYPTKHVINAILRMFIDEHKAEIQKALKSI